MDVDALLEAFQDFEKKGKKETCPALEQFLCHVAKTGQPMLSWSQFKTYFMFKLEKVMDDFNSSTPEQRNLQNPNVEYVPFEEMKTRIIKIVDAYNGIPFTIQRLCELLTDPKRNYSGTEKFLRGLEKNVMVVSCVYTGASGVNRMNGVMFPGNSSLYSESRNVNGPGLPKPLTRPKLSMSLSTNGLPDFSTSKETETTTEEQHEGDSSLSEHTSPNSGLKNKHSDDEEEDEDKQGIKRLKVEEKEEEMREEKEESAERTSESPEPSTESCQEELEGSCDTAGVSDDPEPTSTKPHEEQKEEGCESEAAQSSDTSETITEQEENPLSSEDTTRIERTSPEKRTSVEPDSSEEQKPSSCNPPEPPPEGDTDISSSAETTAD